MEEQISFDDWLKTFKPVEVEYGARFDPVTGTVLQVGPIHAFANDENKIQIPESTAIDIIEGRIKIHSCFIDTDSETLEITETRSLFKIDDVLHRVISTQWAEEDKADIYLTHSSTDNTIKIELAKKYGGTKDFGGTQMRKMYWSGDTELTFTVTGYNDPHIIYESFTVTVSELVDDSKTIELGNDVPNRFSIFTRRVFKNYMIEYA
jgi:hypothetical protein